MTPEGAYRVFDGARIDAAYDGLAGRLDAMLPDEEVLILPVMNGGIFPACELSRRLNRRMRFDYVHASRYRGGTRGGRIEWIHWPELSGRTTNVVVVDDIFDEGHTLAAIRARMPETLSVITVALVRKLHDRGLARDWIDLYGLDAPDVYLFGCGMDYHGNYRELAEIWAMPEAG